MTGIRLKSKLDGSTEDLKLHRLSSRLDTPPIWYIFQGQLTMENGYIVTQGGLKGFATQTSVPGICRW